MENYNFFPEAIVFFTYSHREGVRERQDFKRIAARVKRLLQHARHISIQPPAHASLHTPLTSNTSFPFLLLFQYYEMSYGLNVEMHKQVSLPSRLHLNFKWASSNRWIPANRACVFEHAVSNHAVSYNFRLIGFLLFTDQFYLIIPRKFV